MIRASSLLRVAAALASVATLTVGGFASATIDAPQTFVADSGDRCPLGFTKGTLTWNLVDQRTVEIRGVVLDRPVSGRGTPPCENDGRFSAVTFTGFAQGVEVDRAVQRADNEQRDFVDSLGSSSPTSRGIDLVVVQVCRHHPIPGPPDYCGERVKVPAL